MLVDQQHHDIALLAAQAARERCHNYGPTGSLSGISSSGMSPSAAGKAVTDAYAAAIASLNPPAACSPSLGTAIYPQDFARPGANGTGSAPTQPGSHAANVLYPAIEAAMKELDQLDPGFNFTANRAFNILHGAFWSESQAPASASPLRTAPERRCL